MFDIQKSGTANRLTRPIAVVGARDAYIELCRIAGLNPHNNDVFRRVTTVRECMGARFSRVLEVEGSGSVRDHLAIVSAARSSVRN